MKKCVVLESTHASPLPPFRQDPVFRGLAAVGVAAVSTSPVAAISRADANRLVAVLTNNDPEKALLSPDALLSPPAPAGTEPGSAGPRSNGKPPLPPSAGGAAERGGTRRQRQPRGGRRPGQRRRRQRRAAVAVAGGLHGGRGRRAAPPRPWHRRALGVSFWSGY